MALKDKFAASIAARTGLPPHQAAAALAETIDLLKSKVPALMGNSLDALMASENGIDPAHFMLPVAPQAVPRMPEGPFKEAALAATGQAPKGWGRGFVRAFLDYWK